MELVYGAPYRDAAVVLIVLSIGSLSLVWAGSSGHVLTFTGHQRELMILTLIASVVSIALVIAGGYYFGLIGCAVAYGLARIFQAGLIWWQAKRLTGYWTHATLHPAYLREAWQRLRGSRSAKRSAP